MCSHRRTRARRGRVGTRAYGSRATQLRPGAPSHRDDRARTAPRWSIGWPWLHSSSTVLCRWRSGSLARAHRAHRPARPAPRPPAPRPPPPASQSRFAEAAGWPRRRACATDPMKPRAWFADVRRTALPIWGECAACTEAFPTGFWFIHRKTRYDCNLTDILVRIHHIPRPRSRLGVRPFRSSSRSVRHRPSAGQSLGQSPGQSPGQSLVQLPGRRRGAGRVGLGG
jgi:hypothetical protein